MKVLNFGSLNIDYSFEVDHLVKPGETESSSAFLVTCGGKGLNQSVALKRAGVDVYHAGAIGKKDENGGGVSQGEYHGDPYPHGAYPAEG